MRQPPLRVDVVPGEAADVEAFLRQYLEAVLDELRKEGDGDDESRARHGEGDDSC